MNLKEQITAELTEALKSGDSFKRSVLGMLKAAITNKEIEKRKKEEGLSEVEIQEVVRSEVKKRLDAAATFGQAGENERAHSETAEAEVLRTYLPPQASDEDVKAAVEKAIGKAGSRSKKDFGKIMGLAVKEVDGRADGHRIKQILEGLLE